MKKILPLPILSVVLGFGGYILRKWQLATAFEEETGLLIPGCPATWLLIAVAAVTAVAALLLSRWAGKDLQGKGYLRAFGTRGVWGITLHCVAGLFLLAGGAMALAARSRGTLNSVLGIILGACLLVTGLGVIAAGVLCRRKEEAKGRFAWPPVIPGYCGCVWLVYAYQDHTANPNIMEYVFLLLGIVLAILASYSYASFSFEKPRPRLALWLSAVGFVFLFIALGDMTAQGTLTGDGLLTGWNWESLMTIGFMLYLLTQMIILLVRTQKPIELVPWMPEGETPAAPPEEPEEELDELNGPGPETEEVKTGDDTDE